MIVDIYSRYLFEKEVFERRAKCRTLRRRPERHHGARPEGHLRRRAGRKATCKSSCGPGSRITTPAASRSTTTPTPSACSFATGLYAIYQKRGADFVPDYKDLLASTGEARAAELADQLRHQHPHQEVLGRQPCHHRQARG
ncbi:MAG: hypothetical protein MZV64_58925 [Ignavibacteriales bacterium]|nr:hypothetical protein [Ignavibacteriales bacterium]